MRWTWPRRSLDRGPRRPRPRGVARRRRHAARRARGSWQGGACPSSAVNLGDIGFITEITHDELIPACEDFLAGTSGFSERLMLAVSVRRGRGGGERSRGLNDAVVSTHGHLAHDPPPGAAVGHPVGRYRADGVIVATPDWLDGLLDGRRRPDRATPRWRRSS
ncbi:MAG: hypothetical protein MZV64_25950 [Ignavibacteriales bacterium]|nr:hypothetical protein [Ignavibacteriales bacterium]